MFSPSTMLKDVWAGVTVALVALPLNLALAIAAGVEPGVGITTGIIAGIVAGLFGGQRVAVTGPAAAMAVVLIQIAQTYGIRGIWMVGIIAGSMQIVAGLLKLGRLISYIPMPVMVGFANAIGTLVFFNALDDFLGLPSKPIAHVGQAAPLAGQEFIPEFIQDMSHLVYRLVMHGELNQTAALLGLIAFTIAVMLPKFTKAIPGPLVAIVVATGASLILNLDLPRIANISSIPNMLPLPTVPDLPWQDIERLFAFAVTVFMLGSIESLLSASVADGMTMSRRHHSDQELIGQGMANVIVPFFGGIPVTGVIARTAVNIRAGAQTRLSAIVHSLTLLALIFMLAKYAEQIPLCALAAILLLTGLRLVEWEACRQIWRASRMEGYVVIATTAVSVLIDLTAGVITGLILTCGLFIKQMSEVRLVPATTDADQAELTDVPHCQFVRTYLVDGALFFGAAERFIENILHVENIKVLILHMRAVTMMDLTGVETLLSIHRQLERKGARLILAELPAQSRQLLERTQTMEQIGSQNFFSDYREALITVNREMLETQCRGCADGKGPGGRPDCRVRKAMLQDGNPIRRLLEAQTSGEGEVCRLDTAAHHLARLAPVDSIDDLPDELRVSPIKTVFECQNLGQINIAVPDTPQLIIGMCIDYARSLHLPRDFAYVIRREGANMQGAEFALAVAMLNGISHMALIAHGSCAMSTTSGLRKRFIQTLMENHGWHVAQATKMFDDHMRSKEIDNEIDFVLEETDRLGRVFRGLIVVPLFYRSDNDRLYLIRDWMRQRKQKAVTRVDIPVMDAERLAKLAAERMKADVEAD